MTWTAFIASALSSAGGQTQSGVVSGQLGPLSRASEYAGNRRWPNVVPDVSTLIGLYQRGLISGGELAEWARSQGVALTTAEWDENSAAARSMRPLAALWEKVRRASIQLPTHGELLELLNRGTLTNVQAHDYLRLSGFGQQEIRDLLLSLRHHIPGPSDLERFALREAWIDQIAERYGYDLERPPAFDEWMRRVGYAGDARTDAQKAAGDPPQTWAQLYWRAHWQPVSPTQAYEMFQRLRPNRIARLQGTLPGLRTFSLDDLRTILRINDYPSPFRDQLAAIAYRQPRLIDVEKFYELGVTDQAEVYEQHLDMGYAPTDARNRADFVVRSIRRKRLRALLGSSRSQVINAYRLGAIERDAAARSLYWLLWAGLPQGDRYEAMPQAQQTAVALADPSVSASLQFEDVNIQAGVIKTALAGVKRRFMRGFLSVDEARGRLTDLGIVAGRVERYLEAWQLELGGPFQMLGIRRIQRMAKLGILELPQAEQYLRNLGYRGESLRLLVAESERDLQLEVSKATARTAATQRERQRAQEAALKRIEADKRKQLAELVRQASKSDLKRYFVRGIIDPMRFRLELVRRNFDQASIEAQVQDATIDRQLWLEKRQKAQQTAQGEAETQEGGGNGQ